MTLPKSPREAGVRWISRRLVVARGSVGHANRLCRSREPDKAVVGIGRGSMNELHVVRGYRFRPLSALVSDRGGLWPDVNSSADATENRRR